LFGGYEDGSPPFVKDANGQVQFVGGSDAREQRVDASRLMAMADTGATIFLSSHARGYVAEEHPDNAGSVRFTGPTVVNTGDPDYGSTFTVSFAVDAAGVATYSVADADGNVVVGDQAYGADAQLSFGGLSLKLEGMPADGDSIKVGPGK